MVFRKEQQHEAFTTSRAEGQELEKVLPKFVRTSTLEVGLPSGRASYPGIQKLPKTWLWSMEGMEEISTNPFSPNLHPVNVPLAELKMKLRQPGIWSLNGKNFQGTEQLEESRK